MEGNEPLKPNSERRYYLFALRIAGDFGISIAVPAVLGALLGQYLDELYGHAPLFLVLSLILTAALSAKMIYRKAKKYGEEYQNLK